jgi:ABC-2 type transport system permease protein
MALFAAEIRKLTSVRTTWVLTAAGLVFVAFSVGVFVFEDQFTGVFDGSDEAIGSAIGQIASNSAFVLVVAILAVTTEFRHGTIGRTLQLVPSRTRVLVSKLAVGGGYALAFTALSLAVVLLFVLLRGEGLGLGARSVEAAWQATVALVLTAVLGVALGALIRSQVVALTLSLVWIFVLESLFAAFVPEVGRWLPFQLLNALFVTEEMAGMGGGMADPVTASVALPLFLLYVAVAAVGAGLLMRYRDV